MVVTLDIQQAMHLLCAGLFINTGMGSAFLGTASRRSVNDLQFAHRIWELLARSRRVPDKVRCMLESDAPVSSVKMQDLH